MPECFPTTNVYGPCFKGLDHMSGDPAHIVLCHVYCAEHCPECAYHFGESDSRIMSGEQETLFT